MATFTAVAANVKQNLSAKVTTAEAESFTQQAFSQIWEAHDWAARKTEGLVAIVADYSTGTVDAMQAVNLDQFSQLLDKGINIARSAGADVVFINSQYSPRTESMIALGAYAEYMRWVAVQQEVPLFDRFSIMKLWADLGTFDLYSATKKLDMAERVHDCIGRLLADLVVEAGKPEPPPGIGGRQ